MCLLDVGELGYQSWEAREVVRLEEQAEVMWRADWSEAGTEEVWREEASGMSREAPLPTWL